MNRSVQLCILSGVKTGGISQYTTASFLSSFRISESEEWSSQWIFHLFHFKISVVDQLSFALKFRFGVISVPKFGC